MARLKATGRFETRKEMEKEVRNLRKKTMMTIREIGQECGVSAYATWKILQEMGLTRSKVKS